MRDQEWPEFRRWYELTMEEQRIYNEEDDKDHDRLLDAIDDERGPLEEAMLSRIPDTPTEFAMLGIIELRYAERDRNPEHEECRMLELGMMTKGRTQGRALIQGAIKNAISRNLLPGIQIYGEGGNA
jgi:hypothetical protein